ncbi:hypothetical protein GCM10010965_28490 [Caldalkalibacillus thermarum]|uniref:hypothetical protein n=1 Tax=Caldalkalibacillus thermarum TaxID=296745 RepID=UPI00166C7D5F|nr:hypothetical protein [Caldalkalibacillus thermarum]GGK33879.1 hypothetical protein GCM10010965_28490 [Caldalkalibacillus thermarum]
MDALIFLGAFIFSGFFFLTMGYLYMRKIADLEIAAAEQEQKEAVKQADKVA